MKMILNVVGITFLLVKVGRAVPRCVFADRTMFCRDGCSISGCNNVRCNESRSCRGAKISARNSVDCSSGPLPDNDKVENCQHAEIEAKNKVTCGNRSCWNSSITASEVDCVEEFSCREAEIAATNVKCSFHVSCRLTKITAAKEVDCTGDWSCRDAVIKATNVVDCSGDERSCWSANIMTPDLVKCRGRERSCYFATIDAKKVDCFGSFGCNGAKITAKEVNCNSNSLTSRNSCSFSTIEADQVSCSHLSACAQSKLTADKVDCSGTRSCVRAEIKADKVDCSGDGACENANITARCIGCNLDTGGCKHCNSGNGYGCVKYGYGQTIDDVCTDAVPKCFRDSMPPVVTCSLEPTNRRRDKFLVTYSATDNCGIEITSAIVQVGTKKKKVQVGSKLSIDQSNNDGKCLLKKKGKGIFKIRCAKPVLLRVTAKDKAGNRKTTTFTKWLDKK